MGGSSWFQWGMRTARIYVKLNVNVVGCWEGADRTLYRVHYKCYVQNSKFTDQRERGRVRRLRGECVSRWTQVQQYIERIPQEWIEYENEYWIRKQNGTWVQPNYIWNRLAHFARVRTSNSDVRSNDFEFHRVPTYLELRTVLGPCPVN